MSHSISDNVIDLTQESDRSSPAAVGILRQPAQRQVIDLSDIDDEVIDSPMVEDSQSPEDTPEVEVLYARPREMPRTLEHVRMQAAEHRRQYQARRQAEAPDPAPRQHPTVGLAGFLENLPRLLPFHRAAGGRHPNFANMMNMGLEMIDEVNTQQARNFDQPVLNFETVGFELARNDPPAAPPPRPTYSAPPAPPAGFTRTPTEDDVVVCPNCDSELGQGDEIKRQVWVIRSCGHVRFGSGIARAVLMLAGLLWRVR